MRVLVLNPMTSQAKNIVRDVVYGCWCSGKRIGGATVPPFTLVLLATLLRRNGIEADFVDAQAEQLPAEVMAERIPRYGVLAISTSTMSFQEDAAYLARMKEVNPGLVTVVFGSHPTFMPVFCLAHEGVDLVIRHEPEFILRDLIQSLASGGDYRAIKGIGWKDDGGPVLNEPYPLIENLDDLPFPDVDLLPKGIEYFNPIVRRLPYMTTTTSKGCPGRCVFCTAPTFDGKRVRFQSAAYVLDELKYFASKGVREVYFRDDTFFVSKKRDNAIMNGIIEEGLDLSWIANARVNMIDLETMRLARRAGCHTIKFGIESGSQEVLDRIEKGYKVEVAHEVFAWARECGMHTHAHVMVGNPGDTPETVEQTIEFVLALRPTTATFGICTPYPGTPLFDLVKGEHPEIGDGSAADLSRLHVEGFFNDCFCSLSGDELQDYVKKAYRRFYLRPGYWLKSLKWQLSGIDDVKRISIAATNILGFACGSRS